MDTTRSGTIAAPLAGAASVVLAGVRRELLRYRVALAICAIHAVLVIGLLAWNGRTVPLVLGEYVIVALVPPVFIVVVALIGETVHQALHVRPFRLRAIPAALGTGLLAPERLAQVAVPVVVLPLFATFFTTFKTAIPALVPFHLDQAFMRLDRWLHFGLHPWEILQPVLGHPAATMVVSHLYNMWFLIMYLIVYWQLFVMRDQALRLRYLVAFLLAWTVLGNGLAVLLSSAGPIYYGDVVGGADPYAPLVAHLDRVHADFGLLAREAQLYLWSVYQGGEAAAGGGISAMPSLHVAVATLQALWGWRVDRRLGIALTVYAVIIQIGSVHLGWHYAVDGYVSILCAIGIWWLAGRLVGDRPGRSAAAPSPATAA